MGERVPDKNMIVWILVFIVVGLFSISFINPWFYFDDIVYYAAIVVVLSVLCACLNSGKDVNININRWDRPGQVSIRWGNRCGACGKELPALFKPGQYCPHCDAYIGIRRAIRKSFDVNVGGKSSPLKNLEDDEAIGEVVCPKNLQTNVLGNQRDGVRDRARPRHVPTGHKAQHQAQQPGTSTECTFLPPFDDLFKNQDPAKLARAGNVDWMAVHDAIKTWASAILAGPQAREEQEKKDAFAKWQAWMAFDRAGLSDATLLPIFYQRELAAVGTTATATQATEKKPICPGCGATGDDVVPLSIPSCKDARQEFACKSCGQVFF